MTAEGIIHTGTRLAGVIGWPVAHSLSPALHNHWLKEHRIDGTYVPLPVQPQNLGPVIRALPLMGFRGVNVTVPHKEAVLSFLDDIDPVARHIGAVNLVVIHPDGRLEGRNSDAYGFIEHLREAQPDWRSAPPGADKGLNSAMVLGAGGAARAVVAALIAAGISDIRLVNRNLTRARALAETFGLAVEPLRWEDAAMAMEDVALLVNATNLGMTGQERLIIDLDPLPPQAVVYDLVYAPLETDLLRAARGRGLKTVDGLGMLLHQARPAFKAWFGIDPPVTPALRNAVLKRLEPAI